jgi:glutamate-5-semialdehyde dehydrogenase
LSTEYEWEENPEFAIVLVDNLEEAIDLFNGYSPQFIVSVISESQTEQQSVWASANAPFVGDGFTRWVDGQFSLLRPELGLSNWENGRLFGRSGVLSGDSAFSVRLRVRQADINLHR